MELSVKRTLKLAIGLSALLVTSQHIAAADLSANEILKQVDLIRTPNQSFTASMQMQEYKAKVLKSAIKLNLQIQPTNGSFNSILKYIEPTQDRGKVILNLPNDMWFFDPNGGATVKISPQQRIIGQASNADVVAANFAASYKATKLPNETIAPFATKNAVAAYVLLLNDNTAKTGYGKIKIWVEQSNLRPIKAEFYSKNDYLLKILYYSDYAKIFETYRPTQINIIDATNPTWITTIYYSNFKSANFKNYIFTAAYLPFL